MNGQAYLSDTSTDAERVQLRLLRAKSATERVGMAFRRSVEVIRAARRAIARLDPKCSTETIGYRFRELHYGLDIASAIGESRSEADMDSVSDLLQAIRPVLELLRQLGVRHYIGGSVASSIHGVPRSTLDVDVVAALNEDQACRIVDALQVDYYISREAVLSAVRRRSCFNLIHLATSFKVDIFVSQDREFDRSALLRASHETLDDAGSLSAPVATAEDTILAKLEWYRKGNETSERQWNDLTQVAKLKSAHLDRTYLLRWAKELGVHDLLSRLFSQLDEDANRHAP